MNGNNLLGSIAGIISILGFFPYVIGIIKKRVIPSRITWLIWTIIGAVLLVSYIYASGGINSSIWVPLCYVIGPGIIMILSFYYGEGSYGALDIACFIVCLLSIFLWLISGIPLIALLANIFADAMAAIPTIYKTYLRPNTESAAAWSLFLSGNTLNLFVIPDVNFQTFIYPFYLFLISFIICTCIGRKALLRLFKYE